jgi:histidinol-phosphate aminotransferase
MSRFFSKKFDGLVPYTAGEQPKDSDYIKLNTNESPFSLSENAKKFAQEALSRTNLYPDPDCRDLHKEIADTLGVSPCEVLATNGSDEILNFAFMAFCDKEHTAVFPNITYGFYKVFAEINGIPYEEIPLNDSFEIDICDYIGINKNIFIANPNAPTGIALTVSQIEEILKSNPDNIVVIDEAYVDFGGESCVPLIKKYDNLLLTQTFSKSRSMAGARLGFGVACEALIQDLYKIKYSTNPYNVNSITAALGIGVLKDAVTVKKNCKAIIENREFTKAELEKLGFFVTNSSANFLFAKHNKIGGFELYESLKKRGILVRHFPKKEICDFCRITVGSTEQMLTLIDTIKDILEV